MVGQQGGAFPEHASVPALKLIDFGMARQLGVFHNSNLYRASMVIFVLMTGRQPVGPSFHGTPPNSNSPKLKPISLVPKNE